jgi:broad specificity phosphatase PhoE
MTTVMMIRHGETEWNRLGRWQGHTDVELSEVGHEQARRLAARLLAEGQNFDRLYASDLARAFQTATAIGDALGLPIHPLIELREIHVGIWSGLTREEISDRFPEPWARFTAGVDGPVGEHGETNAALRARIVGIIDHLVRKHPGEHLLVVTHGGPIRALLAHIEDLTGEPLVTRIDNTSITEFDFAVLPPIVTRVNDIAHLGQATMGDQLAR